MVDTDPRHGEQPDVAHTSAKVVRIPENLVDISGGGEDPPNG